MTAAVLRCGCGAEVIPGALWTAADAGAWQAAHAGHGAPEPPPRAMQGTLPEADARALRTVLRGTCTVGLLPWGDGTCGVFVKPRRAA
jgi:hypothetical protein